MKIVLIVDCEGLTFLEQGKDIYHGIGRLKFELNKLISPLRYNKDGAKLVYQYAKENKMPVTFMLVGSKFKPTKGAPNWIGWGYHTYLHKRLTKCTDDELIKEVWNRYGLKSFSAPGWQTDKLTNIMIASAGYKIMPYQYIDGKFGMCQPIKDHGIKKVLVSATPHGNSIPEMHQIVCDILQNWFEDTVYCIQMHDFTFRNTKALDYLWQNIKGFDVVKLEELI